MIPAVAVFLYLTAAAYAVAMVVPRSIFDAVSILAVSGSDVITRAASGTLVLGLLPVVPMTLISALLIVVVSKLTPVCRPGAATLARYF